MVAVNDPSSRRPPSAAEINALPESIRQWIHYLETAVDPAGDLRRLRELEVENAQLRAKLAELIG